MRWIGFLIVLLAASPVWAVNTYTFNPFLSELDTIIDSTNLGSVTGTTVTMTNLISCDTIDTDANGNFECGTDSEGAGGAGDAVTVNSTAVDTTANFLDNIYIDFDIADGGAGGPDDITGKFNYNTLSGDHGLLANEIAFGSSGMVIEGATADTIELYLSFPDPASSDKTITFFNATDTLVGRATTDTLTNKTIDTTNTVTINAADITDQNAGTDVTADLEEETHGAEHNGTDGDYITDSGDTLTGDLDFNDATGDSPKATFTPATGTAWDVYAEDTADDLQIEATSAATETLDLVNTGAGVVDVTIDGGLTLGTDLTVANGGTGASSLTDGGLLLGSGTGAITALGVAANGQIPIGDGTTDPVLATITGTASEVTVTNGAGTITLDLPLNAGTDITADLEEEVTEGSLADDTITEAELKAVDVAADEECLTYEATVGDFEWQACGGGATAWDDIGDPDANGTIAFAAFEQIITLSQTDGDVTALTLDFNQVDDADALDDVIALGLELTSESGDVGDTVKGLVISYEEGVANTVLDAAIEIDNEETTASTMTDAIVVKSSGVADGVVDGLDVSDANITNAVNFGANILLAADGGLVDLSAINASGTVEGLLLPQGTDVSSATAEGQLSWDTDDEVLYIGNGTTSIPVNAYMVGGVDTTNRTGSFSIRLMGEGTPATEIPHAVVCQNLIVRTATAPNTGNSWACTVQDDSINTSLTCTMSGTDNFCRDTTNNTGEIAALSQIRLRCIESGTADGTGGEAFTMECFVRD